MNHAVMTGTDPVVHDGETIRRRSPGTSMMGFRVNAYPQEGFVHYVPTTLRAGVEIITEIAKPHRTVLVEIVLDRIVHEGVFRLTDNLEPEDFRDDTPGSPLEGD